MDHCPTSRCSRRAAGARGAEGVAWGAPLAAERQDVGPTYDHGDDTLSQVRCPALHVALGSRPLPVHRLGLRISRLRGWRRRDPAARVRSVRCRTCLFDPSGRNRFLPLVRNVRRSEGMPWAVSRGPTSRCSRRAARGTRVASVVAWGAPLAAERQRVRPLRESREVFACDNCGASVSRFATQCPSCRALLAGIRCRSCGFEGTADQFSSDRPSVPT